MLARLSIRDIVLIERLDLEFARGLAVLTGETGAGKSILLDSFALALGGRGDAGLVRHGAEQGQVTATFDIRKGHPATKILADNGLDDASSQQSCEMILRRVQFADGRTRAFINDQSVSVQTLKAVGATLVEIHGQHDERALVDASSHRRLLDAFAGLEKEVAALETLWEARRAAVTALEAHRASMERAAREADYLRHSSDELRALAIAHEQPVAGIERSLACHRGGGVRRCFAGRHAPQCQRETLRFDRLQQIIERVQLEGAHGVLIERRNEDNRGLRGHRGHDVEPGALAQLNVEKHDVGGIGAQHESGLGARRGFLNDVDLGMGCEQPAHLAPGGGLVVDDQDPHGTLSGASIEIVARTHAPSWINSKRGDVP